MAMFKMAPQLVLFMFTDVVYMFAHMKKSQTSVKDTNT